MDKRIQTSLQRSREHNIVIAPKVGDGFGINPKNKSEFKIIKSEDLKNDIKFFWKTWRKGVDRMKELDCFHGPRGGELYIVLNSLANQAERKDLENLKNFVINTDGE